jgi:hypothetical protein
LDYSRIVDEHISARGVVVYIHVNLHSTKLVNLRVVDCGSDIQVGTYERRCAFHDPMHPRVDDSFSVVLDYRVSMMIVKGEMPNVLVSRCNDWAWEGKHRSTASDSDS